MGGLTAISVLGIGGLLALPIFVLPAIIAGTPIDRGLEHAALLGIGAFFLFAGFSAVVLVVDGPMHWAGRVIQAVRNKVLRKRPPLTGLPDKLVTERNRIRVVLGHQWKSALLLSSGRLAFDFITLLACIWATGTKPQPSLVLLAYAVAGLLGLIPITPGGLGIVEAGLSGMLILAGIPGGAAVLATLAYRIISYWLPALAGPVAYVLFRGARRATRAQRPAGDAGGGRGLRSAGRGRRRSSRPAARRVKLQEWRAERGDRVPRPYPPRARVPRECSTLGTCARVRARGIEHTGDGDDHV